MIGGGLGRILAPAGSERRAFAPNVMNARTLTRARLKI